MRLELRLNCNDEPGNEHILHKEAFSWTEKFILILAHGFVLSLKLPLRTDFTRKRSLRCPFRP